MISRPMQITLILLVLTGFGMSFYALKLKQKAERIQNASDTRPAAPPAPGNSETVSAWIAYDEDGSLRQQRLQAQLPVESAERAREILRAMTALYQQKDSHHSIDGAADINAVYVLKDGTAVVDLNGAFADRHRSGIQVEELTLFSMVETLSANLPQVTRVHFLVDGKERDTLAGHASLNSYYDVATVSQLIRESQ